MKVKVHKSLEYKKRIMAHKMHKTVDSVKSSHTKDKHGFIKNATGYTAMQSFK